MNGHLQRYDMLMERARWHHQLWPWYLDPARKFSDRQRVTALQSAIHHQEQSTRLYAEARKAREEFQS